MADKKSVGHAYNVDFLNVVFAASSLFLFLSVVWMVWDDFDRDWKNTQRRFAELQYQVTQAQYRQAAGAVDKSKSACKQEPRAKFEFGTKFPMAPGSETDRTKLSPYVGGTVTIPF